MLCNQPVSPLKNIFSNCHTGEVTVPKKFVSESKTCPKLQAQKMKSSRVACSRFFPSSKIVCEQHLINICLKALQIRYACENSVRIKIQFADHQVLSVFVFIIFYVLLLLFYQSGCFILLKIDCDIYIFKQRLVLLTHS